MAVLLPTLPKAQRAFLVGIQTPDMPEGEGNELLAELTELVENLGLSVARAALVKLRSPSPALFLGKGKAEEHFLPQSFKWPYFYPPFPRHSARFWWVSRLRTCPRGRGMSCWPN